MFLAGEWFIRKHLWRFRNRDLDFDGKWFGITYYIHLEIESGNFTHNQFSPFSRKHIIDISQDCTNIAIMPTRGRVFVVWESIAINLTDAGSLRFAYIVIYEGGEVKFPERAIGYEEMNVIKRDSANGKTPILMSGFFQHCAGGQAPVYRGNTIFARAAYLHTEITKKDLPEFAYDLLKGEQL